MTVSNILIVSELVNEMYLRTINSKEATLSIVSTKDQEVIGIIGFYNYSKIDNTAEIEFYLAENFMNQKIMSRALFLMIEYGFLSLKLSKILACHTLENVYCKKLIVKNNFTFDYIEKSSSVKAGYKTDIFHYYLKN